MDINQGLYEQHNYIFSTNTGIEGIPYYYMGIFNIQAWTNNITTMTIEGHYYDGWNASPDQDVPFIFSLNFGQGVVNDTFNINNGTYWQLQLLNTQFNSTINTQNATITPYVLYSSDYLTWHIFFYNHNRFSAYSQRVTINFFQGKGYPTTKDACKYTPIGTFHTRDDMMSKGTLFRGNRRILKPNYTELNQYGY